MTPFFLDEDLGASMAAALRAAGHVVYSVREEGLAGASDPDVLAAAQNKNAILVTGDRDFTDLRHFPVGSHSGIVVLRIPDTVSYRRKIDRLMTVLREGLVEELAGGNLAIVTMTRVRIRRA